MSQFHFKQFSIEQSDSAMKVTLDACLFAAYIAQQRESAESILDLGMGTGLLGLMLAQRFDAQVTGIELDDAAYHEALTNISSSPFHQRIKVIQADIRKWRSQQGYDLIVSNPPFFSGHLTNPDQQKAMARHNASLPFADLLTSIEHHLHPQGQAWILLPTSETITLQRALEKSTLFINKITQVRSKPNKPPHRVFISLKPFSQQSDSGNQDVDQDDICIHNGNEYSAQFKELLQPYYLKL